MSPNNTRSQTPMPKVTAHLSIWGVPTILDTSSDLRGCVHARAAEEVQSAVQGRSRADGARGRQADRRGRSRLGDQRGHPRQLGEHLAPRESGADDRIDSGGACACEGNGRRDPPAADGERVPKKSSGLLRADATVAERCALIGAEKGNYDVTFMCALLKVPRSSYYAWTRRAETPTRARRRALAVEVAKEFTNSRQTSGCRRIAAALTRRGSACSVGLIADLMRELGLAAVQPRAYKRTPLPGDAPRPAPDLLGRDFTAEAPGQRLVGDITYLRTGEGWLYLATVIDLATRMVVGWQLAGHMRTTLVTDALAMAIDGGHVAPDAIFHSDRGAQYTSAEFDTFTRRKRIRRSLGRTGVCWDNAAAESFFAALKNEMYYRQSFATRARARFAVAKYIEFFYTRRRLHSTLGYRTPFEALTDYRTAATAAA